MRVAVTPMMMLQRSTEQGKGRASRETRELDLHVIMKETESPGEADSKALSSEQPAPRNKPAPLFTPSTSKQAPNNQLQME